MKNTNPELIKTLESIVDAELDQHPLPVVKGNSIRIKNAVVRKNKYGYHVFDLAKKEHIGYWHTKLTAVAIAHCVATNRKHSINNIEYLDNKLSKYYNDAIFYKHTVENTKDDLKKEAALMRFEIAVEDCWVIREQIENYLFDK
jgi:hypothetical protein